MKKSLLYRLFGFGKIPPQVRLRLETENIQLLDEGVRGSVTYINFKSPIRRCKWKCQLGVMSIVLTSERLLGLANSKKIMDVPLSDKRLCNMKLELMPKGGLMIAFDPALFHQDWSGTLEFRFRTEKAKDIFDKLSEIQHVSPEK